MEKVAFCNSCTATRNFTVKPEKEVMDGETLNVANCNTCGRKILVRLRRKEDEGRLRKN
jgi:DNA-directed RNA polymerase subunit RPC12/RpoP